MGVLSETVLKGPLHWRIGTPDAVLWFAYLHQTWACASAGYACVACAHAYTLTFEPTPAGLAHAKSSFARDVNVEHGNDGHQHGVPDIETINGKE